MMHMKRVQRQPARRAELCGQMKQYGRIQAAAVGNCYAVIARKHNARQNCFQRAFNSLFSVAGSGIIQTR